MRSPSCLSPCRNLIVESRPKKASKWALQPSPPPTARGATPALAWPPDAALRICIAAASDTGDPPLTDDSWLGVVRGAAAAAAAAA
eukprot:CAMPEP_0115512260 /NCGR_PEP_ID=MMETSP0271-20121206/74414_1 /TAXON_ID=71861 /ORGANISM="Scrippsiella trochoidea, Strain CCMP3099" /LENGTH=85 /DNA_ID=CAMNT_0002942405 /DNA_START=201 /DNA_END=455 /DNA_ORIENTATION=+